MDRSPSSPQTTRIPGRRVFYFGLILVLGISGFLMLRIWSGLDREGTPAGSGADSTAEAPIARLSRTVIYSPDPGFTDVELNPHGIHVGDDLAAFQVANLPGVWAVDLTWYYLGGEPLRLYNFAEMTAMEESGRIDDTTPVGFAVYRFRVEGDSPEEVSQAALARRPAEIPPGLLEKLRRTVTGPDAVND
jgi:hypothetical protein